MAQHCLPASTTTDWLSHYGFIFFHPPQINLVRSGLLVNRLPCPSFLSPRVFHKFLSFIWKHCLGLQLEPIFPIAE